MTNRDSASGAVATLCREMLDDLPALAQQAARWIATEADAYGMSTAVPEEDLVRSCSENLGEMLRRLAGEPVDAEAPIATGRRRAEQGFPIANVLHAFRLGGRMLWADLVERARRAGVTTDLVEGAGVLWGMVDDYSVKVTAAYQQRMSELTRLDVERRTLVVDAVLAGLAAENPSLPEAAAALGLPLRGAYLAVSADPATADVVERVVADQLRGRGGTAAWRLRTGRYLGIVSLGRTVTAAEVRAALEAHSTHRVGLSPPFADLTATPEAARLADVARASVPPGTAGVCAHDDEPIRSLLVSDADAGWRAGRTVLDPVLALDSENRALLLDTLRTWFAAGGSASEAGKRLYCHRNTVRNRLQRLEELTGRSLEDPKGLAELYVASQAVELLARDR